MIGEKFDRLMVVGEAPSRIISGRSRKFWMVRCDCGEVRGVSQAHLRSGHTKSCGCLVLGQQLSGAEASRRYRERHPDRVKESQARFDPDRRREISREWARRNPEKTLEARRRRIARLAAVLSIPFTEEQLVARLSMWGNLCWVCGDPSDEVDHVKPISKGGAHILANLRPICRSCNASKGAKWPFPVRQVPTLQAWETT